MANTNSHLSATCGQDADAASCVRIDIDEVLRAKAGAKARLVPGFVRAWLRRTVHQEQLNADLAAMAGLQGVPWLDAAVETLSLGLRVHGAENLPDDSDGRRFTFVSNHPLGGLDGIALGKVLGHRYDGRIRYLVNDLLMNLHGLAPLCVPINKTGRQGRDFPRMVEAAFSGENHVIMFPAGLCSRREHGVIADLPWQKAFVTKSAETRRDVVPIHFGGHNSGRFYRWAAAGKRLGLKFNIAMLLLVDEMYKNAGHTFDIHIGKPIPWQTFDRSRRPAEWAAWVRERVYSLPAGE